MAGTGSTSTGKHFGRVLVGYGDPSFISRPEEWKKFLSDLVEAYELDLYENKKKPDFAVAAKDIKPAKFDASAKTSQTFKAWAQDAMAYVKKVKREFVDVLKVAEKLEAWNEETSKLNVEEDTSVSSALYADVNEDLVALLRNITEGDA